MKTIEAEVMVTPEGHLTLDVPINIAPGSYRAVVVIEETSLPEPPSPSLDDWPVDDLGPWPEGLTLSREELYDDNGR